MTYLATESVKLKTSKGVVTLQPGQRVTLPERVASELLREGRIRPEKPRYAVRIFSEVLGAYLWVIANDVDFRPDNGEAVYTHGEVNALRNTSPTHLRAVHAVKTALPDSRAVNTTLRPEKPNG